MSCCAGCSSGGGGGAHDPEAGPLDLSVLEAGEHGVKIELAMRRARATTAAWLVPSRRRDYPEFVVSVYGGPNSDIAGPRQDRVRCRLGDRVVHEVQGLVPDTEYTLEFMQAASMEGQPLRSRTVAQRLEVRTAAASTCQFAGEDWGRSCKDGKDGKDLKNEAHKQEPGAHSSSSSSSSSQQGLAGATAALLSQLQGSPGPRHQRSQSGDDCSTIAPSDAGDADRDIDDPQERPDETWEAVEEQRSTRQAPRELSSTSDVISVELDEVMPTPATVRSTQCNLWAMWDCLKSGRMSWKRSGQAPQDPNELVVSDAPEPRASVPVQPPQRPQGQQQRTRMRRPHRPAFPGTAVDPATVGLELLPALNESQLQAVIDDRCRNHRRANGI
eukprot:TRINITY_DN62018_c0_g1_i1.p1 TRINITY_DN62018_c0_g1~~TRINITY_DN62018_c0_g1_i1.p1  ORF type:complete len:386 (-),score=47.85 TRINITY_DN62018_c0_g1_i1:42-1199(-)